jgi:hypothetical protein
MFYGCGTTTTGGDDDVAAKAPTSYTQKALLEYFSGTWCPYCPDGKVYANNITASVGAEKFTSVVYHYGDNMDNFSDDAIDDKFNTGYPKGMINRVGGETVSRSTWQQTVNQVLGETAKCGLAIDATSVDGVNMDIKVKLGIGAEALPEGNYFLTVLVREDVMTGTGTGWDQINGYNTTAGHAFYQKGSPIVGYEHDNVVRNMMTAALGDELTADQVAAGALSEFEFTANLAGYGEDVTVVAFICEYTESLTSGNSSFMYNVQTAAKGTKVDFD